MNRVVRAMLGADSQWQIPRDLKYVDFEENLKKRENFLCQSRHRYFGEIRPPFGIWNKNALSIG